MYVITSYVNFFIILLERKIDKISSLFYSISSLGSALKWGGKHSLQEEQNMEREEKIEVWEKKKLEEKEDVIVEMGERRK